MIISPQTGRSTFTVAVNFNKSSLHNEQLIEKIDKVIDSVIAVSEHDLFFKIKIGASFWPQDADNVHDLLLKSVLALECAVSRQSNEYVFYSPEMEQTILRENKIEHHLKNAIVLNELYMVYQPR